MTATSERRVRVFFYGTFINAKVLAEVDLVPQAVEVARLWGYDIQIGPLATVVPSDRACVYGIVCEATHAELDRLYAQEWVGLYLPEPVVVETQDDRRRLPALCYIAANAEPGPPDDDYIARIVDPAREFGFPEWYVKRLESFRSGGG